MKLGVRPTAIHATSGKEVVDTTLLELVRAVSEVTDDEREVVATVIHMLRSGSVRLSGALRGSAFYDAA